MQKKMHLTRNKSGKNCGDEFINKLPQKYNTLVGEMVLDYRGQKQRISIEAILKSPLILLDGNSSLDMNSEEIVQNAIEFN